MVQQAGQPPLGFSGAHLERDAIVSFDGAIEAHPGGAPFNVCCTIARLEREAAFLGALSDDRFGTTLGSRLAAARVR